MTAILTPPTHKTRWRANWLAIEWARLLTGEWAWTRIPTTPHTPPRRAGRIDPKTGIVDPFNTPPSGTPTPMHEIIVLPPYPQTDDKREELVITPTWYHLTNKRLGTTHHEALRHYANNGTPMLWGYNWRTNTCTPTPTPHDYRAAATRLEELTR